MVLVHSVRVPDNGQAVGAPVLRGTEKGIFKIYV